MGQLTRRNKLAVDHRRHTDAKTDVPEENPLCQTCRTKGVWEHLSTSKLLGPGDWIHGFIIDPEDVNNPDRRSCPFCKMVFDVMPETAFAKEHRHMYREESGRKIYCSLRPITIKVRKELFTSFVVAYWFREYVSHSSKVFQNYRATICLDSRARRSFNTRGIASVKFQDTLNPDLIRKWISRCQRSHGFCTETQRRLTYRSLRTMMIDVRSSCLVEAATHYRYAALSYVWGQVQSLQTTKANAETLMTPGALQRDDIWNQLPRVIQDCIRLSAMIEVPYLWVDCLCIVQDDVINKHEQIAGMDTIYLHAQITIFPFAGKNAHSSIPGVLPGTRAKVSMPIPSSPDTKREHDNIALASSPEWPSLTYDAVHESRAWTLQEKVLSIRCLFVSRWGMWFQCLTSRYSDVEPGELPREPENSSGTTLLTLETPRDLRTDDWKGWDSSRIDEFLSFALHAEWFSARKLTFQIDRIDAFRGILNLFEDLCQQEFLWAHPEGPLLPVSLLWVHVDVGRSRDAKGSLDEVPFYQDYLPDRDTDYPTWSWTGWNSRVSFSLVLELDNAGIDLALDGNFDLTTQPALDEEDARQKGVDKWFSPALFNRNMNRGTLEFRGPSISVADMSCGPPKSLHLTALDDTTGVFALAHPLYPFFKADPLTWPSNDQLPMPPCGMLFGIPFSQPIDYEHHRFVLLKTIPAESTNGCVGNLFKSHGDFRSLFEGSEGQPFCIALLIWLAGKYAERQGVAILDKAFWDSRNPVVDEYFLL